MRLSRCSVLLASLSLAACSVFAPEEQPVICPEPVVCPVCEIVECPAPSVIEKVAQVFAER